MKHSILTLALLFISCASLAQPLLLDVRTQAEFDEDHAKGAIHLPFNEVKEKAADLLPNKSQEIKVYCRSGNRAGKAISALKALGYTNLENIRTLENAKQFAQP
ncbi:MAG: rhodanese-like domain-containing protein [Gammaproteobacteria bacterium]|nr:rhodanese-like domain-containing protein [Gammaproteobacteria bacterium]